MSMVANTGRLMETSERNIPVLRLTPSGPVVVIDDADLHPAAERAHVADDHAFAFLEAGQDLGDPGGVIDDADLHRLLRHGLPLDGVHVWASVFALANRRARNDESLWYRPAHDSARHERPSFEHATRIRDLHVDHNRSRCRIDRRAHANDASFDGARVGGEARDLAGAYVAGVPCRHRGRELERIRADHGEELRAARDVLARLDIATLEHSVRRRDHPRIARLRRCRAYLRLGCRDLCTGRCDSFLRRANVALRDG